MKLWLLTQNEADGYDTFDAVIVAAPDQESARTIHPYETRWFGDPWEHEFYPAWASKKENVQVKLIGDAAPGVEHGVILASFNAG